MTKMLLIDLDGTLLGAHSKRLHWYFIRSFAASLKKLGFNFFQSLSILHRLKLSVRNEEFQMNGTLNWDKAVVFFSQLTGLSPDESRKQLTKISMQCFVHASPSLYALSEAQDFVSWAKEHYRLVLATNPLWPAAVVDYRLSIAGILPSEFEFITHAENMSTCKPNVHYYQELTNKLNLIPAECLMIGNDEEKDGPARNVGIETVIIKKPSDFKKLKLKLEKNNG
jgi:FMN phosphatase YigB (HAD superfamily)